MEPCAAVNGTPMARSTCDGSSEPEVQAEPEEAQMSYWFMCRRMASPSTNSKLMLAVLGSRSVLWPLSRELRDVVEQAVFQLVAQGAHPGVLLGHFGGGQLAGLAQADDGGDVFRAAAPAMLLVSAVQEGDEGRALADVEDADALGGMELVAGDGEKVDAGVLQVDGDLAHGLDRVGVEEDAPLPGHGGHLLHRER